MKNSKYLILLVLALIAAGICYFFYYKPRIENVAVPKSQSVGTEKNPTAIIVPHHDLVKEERKKLFQEFKDNSGAKTIIVVSTNHFNTGSDNIETTKKSWNLSNGNLGPNTKIIDDITKTGLVADDENAFQEEHGVKNILPDIVTFFPEKEVVPIIIKSNTEENEVLNLAEILYKSCNGECLLISSVDFSHYQPGALAEIHDDLSIRAITNLDTKLVKRAEVDSKETLLFTTRWAQLSSSLKFNLFENTNSGKIEKSRDAETTSYVLGWYGKGQIPDPKKSFTFMIGGDMMFDRDIDYQFRDEKIFNVMKNFGDRVFSGTDLSLVNLEGPISPTPIEANNTPGNLIFNFPPKTPDVLFWMGINAVSLANNHTLNNGQDGLTNTKKVLLNKNISYIGQDAVFNNESIKTFDNGSGIKLSVIAIDILDTNMDLLELIKNEKNAGHLVLVYPHWGTEYATIHSKSQEELAHAWIDAGADFVFGSHPHVVQDAEIYQGKPIFYSLGNLLFDQKFSEETQRGLIVAAEISRGKLKLVLLPTISKNYMPELLRGQERTDFLSKFRKYLGAGEVSNSYGYDTTYTDLDEH